MASGVLSDSERSYILRGVQANFRSDGRHTDDYRCIELEINVLPHAEGSASVRLGDTRVLVAVKLDLGDPASRGGRLIAVNVDCSSSVSERDHSENDAFTRELSSIIECMQLGALEAGALWLVPNSIAWLVYVDVVVLELGGNLIDAISMGVFAALRTTRVPRASVIDLLGEGHRVELNEKLTDALHLKNVPLITTVSKVGERSVVDLTTEEELCALAQLLVTIDCGDQEARIAASNECRVLNVRKIGGGSLKLESMREMLTVAVASAQRLAAAFRARLAEPTRPHTQLDTVLF